MKGTMVRKDISISLISCQFESSTVLILEAMFVFISGTEQNSKRRSFFQKDSEFFIFFKPFFQKNLFGKRSILFSNHLRAFLIGGPLHSFATRVNNVRLHRLKCIYYSCEHIFIYNVRKIRNFKLIPD